MSKLAVLVLIGGFVCAAYANCNSNSCKTTVHGCRGYESHVQCLLEEAEKCTALQTSEKTDLNEAISVQRLIRDTVCSSSASTVASIMLSLLAFSVFHMIK